MNAIMTETPQEAARRFAASVLAKGYAPAGLHEYQNADGTPAFWRIRYKHPNGDKWIRPMSWTGAGYEAKEPPAPSAGKLLYRLPELLADPAALVWIVEGEACADALARLGLTAVTSGGKGSADAADWTPLRGRRARIWPDHDKPGAEYAEAVAARLLAIGCTVELIDVAALNLPDKGDCVDWLEAHPDATADDVRGLGLLPEPPLQPANVAACVELLRGDAIPVQAVDWLWHGWLAAGKLAILGGQPGTGKTTIALALAATVTIGGRWPDGTRAKQGSVAIWSGEDDPGDTIIPRLQGMGADLRRVHVVGSMYDLEGRYPFDPARDCDALGAALASVPDLRLLVIDPVVSAVAGDSHKNAEVRRGLQPLVDLALSHRCALLGITHFTKGTAGRDPVERITGSLAFGALARLVMVTAKAEAKDDEPARRFLARAKSNIGPDGGGFVYDLQQGDLPNVPGVQASRVLWGAALEGSARELLADAEQQDDEQGQDAAGFLRELLDFGARPAKEVFAEAASAGFSKDAMHRAKRKIGAVAVKRGGNFGGGKQEWAWHLPLKMAGNPEDSGQNCPPPSTPSAGEPPPSGEGMEVFDL